MTKITIIKLTRIAIKETDKDGKPLINQFGKPYKKIGIQTEEHGQTWLSAFINSPKDPRLSWKAGDTKEVIITQNGNYVNFSLPERIDYLELRIEKLENSLQDAELDNGKESEEVTGEDLNF